MISINTSLSTFKGFNSNIISTNKWFTQNKSINLTDYVYGKQKPGIIKKTFNLFKWMHRIYSIKKNIQRLQKISKSLSKIAKFGVKIGGFIFKGLKVLIKIGIKYLAKPIWNACKWIGKGVFKGFSWVIEKLKRPIGWILEKVGNLVKTILNKVFKFVNKKLILPIVNKIKSWLPKLKAIIAPLLDGVKILLKRGFNKIKNLVINDKAKRVFNSGKTFIVEAGKSVKGFIGGTIGFFKEGTNKIITKVIGLGKDAKNLAVVTKDGIIAKGKSAVDWFKYTKRKWKVGLKLVKHKAKMKWFRFTKINKVGKMMAAVVAWGIKLLKFLLKGAKLLMKGISSTIAWITSAATAGTSLIFPLVMGLIFESISYIPKLLKYATKPIKWFWNLGLYILSILGWVNPMLGWAALAGGLMDLLSTDLFIYVKWLFNGCDPKILEEAAGLKEVGLDIIFTNNNAQRLDTIKDLQKHTLTSQILLAKQTTDKFNDIAIDIINILSEKQIIRSNYLTDCVNTI